MEQVTIKNRGRNATIRHDLADRDHVMFAGVATDGEIDLFTADELRELADAMDVQTNGLIVAGEQADNVVDIPPRRWSVTKTAAEAVDEASR